MALALTGLEHGGPMMTTGVSEVLTTSYAVDEVSAGYGKRNILINDSLFFLLKTINFAIICEIIDVFGTITNTINIVIFIKMGFADSVNYSLLGLAISDMGCLAILHWHNLCYAPYFLDLDLTFDPYDVQYLTAGIPHIVFTRITATITAFITLERCLCVTIPLKVKTILNPRRVKYTIISLFVLQLGSAAPIYYSNRLGPKFFESKNRTLIGLVFTADRVQVEKVIFAIQHVIIPFSSFIVVFVCTMIIVAKLREKGKWRSRATTTSTTTSKGRPDNLSTRDQKVTQMVVMISTLFIICFTPVTAIFVAMTIEPEFSINGYFINTFVVVFSFGFIFESINSAMNIFIYYKMSSKYRQVFDTMFGIKRKGSESEESTVQR